MKYSILIGMLMLTTVHAVEQYLTFYSKPDQQGNSVTIRENFEDLEGFGSIINRNGSWEAVGWWDCYYEKNFTRSIHSNGVLRPGTSIGKGNFGSLVPGLSCRHWGASNTDTEAISLYSKTDGTLCLGGVDLLITGPAYGHLPFNPSGVATTGHSNWTFFDGPNFDGTATCIVTNSQGYGTCTSGMKRSVYKSCVGRIDEYVYL